MIQGEGLSWISAGYVGCLADFPSSKSFLHISILSVVQGMCQLG